MNWTGGKLQRHSRPANKGIVQKQKAFFARARTQLQNGRGDLLAPFRPSYFPETQLPNPGGETTLHQGRPRRPQTRNARGDTFSLDARHSAQASECRTTDDHEFDQEASFGDPAPHTPPTLHRSKLEADAAYSLHGAEAAQSKRHVKRQANDREAEDRQLAANRRKLLQKHDWAGLAPSRPLELKFGARRDKHKVCKRRKVEGRPVLQPDRLTAFRGPHLHTDRDPSPYMRGAVENVGNISIRIGTDALSSLTPMQPGDHAPLLRGRMSPAQSSDLMLFDVEEGADRAVQLSMVGYRAPSRELDVSIAPDAAQTPVDRLRCHTKRQDETTPKPSSHLQRRTSRSSSGRSGRHGAEFGALRDAIGSSPQNSGHIGGVSKPLRLDFDEPSDMPVDVSDNARLSRFGRTTSKSGDRPGAIGNETTHSPPASSIDDAPWRALVAVPKYSSSDSSRERYDTSYSPRRHIAKDQDTFAPSVDSHYATLGDNTRISVSSCASTSLPSIKRAEEHLACPGPHETTIPRSHQVLHRDSRDVDESDKLWMQFVFADEATASDRTHSDVNSRDVVWAKRALRERNSRVLPSSLAVAAPISSRRDSTPVGTAPWLTSGAGNSMDNAAGSAASLSTRSRAVSPSTFDQQDDLHALDSAYDAPTTEDGRVFGGQSVTAASLQNNVSHNTDQTLEEISGDSRTSRDGLDRRYGASRRVVGPRLAKRREHMRDPPTGRLLHGLPASGLT